MATPKWEETVELTPTWEDTQESKEVPSELESGARGLAQGASLGFADELTGAVEALWNKAKGNPEEFNKLYQQYRDESRENYHKAQKANPV